MKKYLLSLSFDVGDESNVGLIKIITQKELDETKCIQTGWGNWEGETHEFCKSDAIEISDDEIKVLEKFGLTNLEFGLCDLLGEEIGTIDDDDLIDL